MSHDVWLDSLRRAAGDPDALTCLLAENLPSDALQHIGEAVLTVLELPGTDLTDTVDRLVDRLRERQWDGDAELAETVEHVIGRSASPRQPLPVELADVGEALSEQAGTENYLDLHTGAVWLQTRSDFGVADDVDIDFSDDTRWLFVLGDAGQWSYIPPEMGDAVVQPEAVGSLVCDAIGAEQFVIFTNPADAERFRSWRTDIDQSLADAIAAAPVPPRIF
jgi:hypothetical protein